MRTWMFLAAALAPLTYVKPAARRVGATDSWG